MINEQTLAPSQVTRSLHTIFSGFINPELIVSAWEISRGETVADLGCGGGYFSLALAKAVADEGKVYAVDVRESSLESVRSRAFMERLDNVKTIKGDLDKKNSLKKEIKNGECSVVILASVLYTMKNKSRLIEEADRILAKGGRLIVVEWVKRYQGMVIKNFGPANEDRLSQNDLMDLTKGRGFSLVESFPAGNYHFGMIFRKK